MTIPYNTTALQGIKYLRDQFEFDEIETNLQNKNNPKIYDEGIDRIDDSPINQMISILSKTDINLLNKKIRSKIEGKQIWFKHKTNPEIKLELNDFKELYFILRHVLFDVAPSLQSISTYLKAISKICIKGNTFIP